MKIVVCVKLAPDASDIEIRSDGTISLERAEWRIGSFDLQAIEAALQLKETNSGSVTALSIGPLQINQSKLRKDILSRGPDDLVLVADEALAKADTAVTARVLAAAVRKLGDVDLVLTGEGSSDLYFQQTGLQVGELLEWPVFNAVSRVKSTGNGVMIERSLEDEIEVLDVPLPAVLAVTTDITTPRLPNMKEILLAARKPVTEWHPADLELDRTLLTPQVEVVSVRAPAPVTRKHVLIETSPDEAAQTLTGYLSREGVI